MDAADLGDRVSSPLLEDDPPPDDVGAVVWDLEENNADDTVDSSDGDVGRGGGGDEEDDGMDKPGGFGACLEDEGCLDSSVGKEGDTKRGEAGGEVGGVRKTSSSPLLSLLSSTIRATLGTGGDGSSKRME